MCAREVVESLSTARIPDGTPLGLVQVGLANRVASLRSGRSNHPVKPRSAVVAAVRAGAPPMPETERERAKRTKTMVWKWQRCSKCGRQCDRRGIHRTGLFECPTARQIPGPKGAAVECSTERPRAHQRQGVAPVEGVRIRETCMRGGCREVVR